MPTTTTLRYEAMAAVGVAVAIYFAFKIVGFLGVGILGLLMMFIAIQADFTKGGTSSTYSIIPRPSHQMDQAEKAARRTEAESLSHPILIGKILGLCLAVIGFGALFFL
jgi:hypothetical protein